MYKKEIVIESVPFDTDTVKGVPIINQNTVEFTREFIEVTGKDGQVQSVETYKPIHKSVVSTFKTPEADSTLNITSMTPVEGSKLFFRLQDYAHEIAPDKLPIGEFTLFKEYDYVLEFSDKEITYRDTGIPDSIFKSTIDGKEWNNSKFKTQKDLFKYLISRKAFYFPIIAKRLEHPPEVQQKLELQSLIEKKKLIMEEAAQREKEEQKALKEIERKIREKTEGLK